MTAPVKFALNNGRSLYAFPASSEILMVTDLVTHMVVTLRADPFADGPPLTFSGERAEQERRNLDAVSVLA